MMRNDGLDHIRKLVDQRIKERDLVPAIVSRQATGNPDVVRKFVNEHTTVRADRLKKLAEELGFEFYVGPPRSIDPTPTIVQELGPSEMQGFEMTSLSDGSVLLEVRLPEGLAKLVLTPEGSKALADQLTDRVMQIKKGK